MKKYILLLIIFFNSFVILAQEKPTEYPNFIGKELDSIEKNTEWHVLRKVSDDLNNDTKDDVVVVIESKEDFIEIRCANCETSLSKARIVLVFLCEKGTFKVHTQNNEFIPRSDEGGMSSMIKPELSIEANQLIIQQEYTRSDIRYVFELQKDKFMIVLAESNSVHAATGDTENYVFDFSKNEIILTEGNITDEEETLENEEEGRKEKTKVIKFDKKAKPLSEFKAMSEWKIVEYYRL